MGRRQSKAEGLLACILDNASVSMLCVDRTLRVVLAGRNWRARLRDAHQKCRLSQIFADSAQGDQMERLVRKVFQTRKPAVGRRLKDDACHYEYGVIPFVWQGQVVYALIVLRDITEELRLTDEVRAVQHRLSGIVESASEMVVSLDPSGRIVTWNNAARKVSGLPAQKAVGRKLSDLCPEDSVRLMSRAIARTLRSGRAGPVRLQLHGQGDGVRTVDWAFAAMTDETGAANGVVAVGRDLTEQLEAEARLQQADRAAALGVMAGGIAHELRTPLAVSSAAAQLLLGRPLDKTTQLECAAKIHSAVERASRIIENLLHFARPSGPSRRSTVDIARLIRDALKLVENQRELSKIKLHLALSRRTTVVDVNTTLLVQALTNLLLNAINAMPDGGSLSVSSARKGATVLVRVKDTGRGIPSADLDKVFDPFFTTMAAGKGTGLGLSITYSILKRHGGEIDIESARGRGTSVTISLPAAEEESV